MKTLILTGTILLFGLLAQAQESKEARRGKIEAQKVAFITSELDLTPAESEKFWPIYNKYEGLKKEDRDGFDRREKREEMTDAQASDEINRMIDIKQKDLEDTKSMVRELQGVIPPTKVMKLFKSERKFKKSLLKKMGRKRGKEGKEMHKNPRK